VNRLWPARDRTSDGWIGDPRHASRFSDHNPDRRGRVHALDLDQGGIDVEALVRAAILHKGTHYVIADGLIYRKRRAFSPEPYTGSNPHRSHVHVSVSRSWLGRRSRRSWLGLGLLP
jgi:hypothetical protein